MGLIIFLITGLTASGFLAVLPVTFSGASSDCRGCYQTTACYTSGNRSYIDDFGFVHYSHLWFCYLSPGPISSPRCSALKEVFFKRELVAFLLIALSGFVIRLPGLRYNPLNNSPVYYNLRCFGPSVYSPVHLSTGYYRAVSVQPDPRHLSIMGSHTALITFVFRSQAFQQFP